MCVRNATRRYERGVVPLCAAACLRVRQRLCVVSARRVCPGDEPGNGLCSVWRIAGPGLGAAFRGARRRRFAFVGYCGRFEMLASLPGSSGFRVLTAALRLSTCSVQRLA